MRPAYRYWMIFGVASGSGTKTVAELRFITASGVESDDPTKAFGKSLTTPTFKNGNAFDGVYETYTKSATSTAEATGAVDWGYQWQLGYCFDEPQVVTGVGARMRAGRSSSENWTGAYLVGSHDGVNWVYPSFPLTFSFSTSGSETQYSPTIYQPTQLTPSISTQTVVATDGVGTARSKHPRDLGAWTYASDRSSRSSIDIEFSINETSDGYISGIVYERIGDTTKKVPVQRQVFLHRQDTGKLAGNTWSGLDGRYTFERLKMGKTYMVVSVDHTGKWGLEGAAYKKPKKRLLL